ncbi:MAG: hypothetical protein ABGX16_14895 [Pirellulales bacterium]
MAKELIILGGYPAGSPYPRKLPNPPDVEIASGWQDNVHHFQVTQLLQNATWFVTDPRLLTHLTEHLPQHVCQKADEDVSKNAVFLLMPDRADLEVTLMNAESRFRLGQSKGRHYNVFGNPATLYVFTRHRWITTYVNPDHKYSSKSCFAKRVGKSG